MAYNRKKTPGTLKRRMESELASVFDLAAQVLGSSLEAQLWFSQPAMGLNQQTPEDLVKTTPGEELVRTFLMRMDYYIYC
mgnify:CR=1 FL=1